MLEGISAVDWKKLEDAYDEAEKLPKLLAQGAAGDAKAAKAVATIAGHVNHQGWPSPAAVQVVPFLWEIALAKATPASAAARGATLALLGDLAVAGNHRNFLGAAPARSAARELLDTALAKALRAAVAARAAEAVALLGDASLEVRACASFVIALALAPREKAVAAILVALEREKNVVARTSHAIALGYALAGAGARAKAKTNDKERKAAALALRKLLTKKDASRTGAAIGLAIAGEVEEKALAALLEAAGAAPTPGVAWSGGDLASHAVEVLMATGAGGEDDTSLVEIAPPMLRGEIALSALRRVFKKEIAAGEKANAKKLDAPQQRVLRMIASRDDLYNNGTSPIALMEKLGIPYLPWEITTRLLGDPPPPPSPLESPLKFAGKTESIRKHWGNACRENDTSGAALAVAIAEALEPEVLVRAAIEAQIGRVAWGRKSDELLLLCLVAKGASVLEAVRAEMARLEKNGPPKRWEYGPNGARAVNLGNILLVAAATLGLPSKELARLRRRKHFSAPNTIDGFCTEADMTPRTREIAQAYLRMK